MLSVTVATPCGDQRKKATPAYEVWIKEPNMSKSMAAGDAALSSITVAFHYATEKRWPAEPFWMNSAQRSPQLSQTCYQLAPDARDSTRTQTFRLREGIGDRPSPPRISSKEAPHWWGSSAQTKSWSGATIIRDEQIQKSIVIIKLGQQWRDFVAQLRSSGECGP
jgi:hypothetical protein